MKKTFNFILVISLLSALYSCENSTDQSQQHHHEQSPDLEPLVEKVLTAEEQEALTPDKVLELLRDGNQRFMNGTLTARDHSAQVRNSTFAQYPKAVILSCLDSRVPVEDVFDRGIGDIFVGRVAGNFVNEDLLGSIEFGCKVAGAKLILVMGHEHCGAVKSAIDGVELGNITAMLSNIKPAMDLIHDFEGEKSSENAEYVHEVCESNVRNTINNIRINSPILKEMEENGEVSIVGAIYDMSSGEVVFLEE